MAQTDKKTSSAQPKRLARAKVKRPKTDAEKALEKEDRKKLARNIAISAFAVLLVASMMVPSLAAIVSNARQARATKQAQEALSTLTGDEVTNEQIDAIYGSGVSDYEATLADNPNNTETLLALGNQYLSWGYAAGVYGTEDSAAEHSAELLSSAISYYDRYLEIEDSKDVAVNRALSQLYMGDVTAAQGSLESVVASHPNNAEAWANLGMIYELTNPDGAAMAYERAIAADPDDETGAKSYAEGRLEAIEDAASAAGDDIADADATDAGEASESAEADEGTND